MGKNSTPALLKQVGREGGLKPSCIWGCQPLTVPSLYEERLEALDIGILGGYWAAFQCFVLALSYIVLHSSFKFYQVCQENLSI